jgi:hypothetical protein
MAARLLERRVAGCLYSNRFGWKSIINSKLGKQYDLQSRKSFSFKFLKRVSKGIKEQLDDVNMLTRLRVSNK